MTDAGRSPQETDGDHAALALAPQRGPHRVRQLLDALLDIRAHMLALEIEFEDTLHAVHPAYQASARNLVHYLALRQHDMRPLQVQLAALGLSSLGRCEAHVMRSLNAVLEILHHLAGQPWQLPDACAQAVSFTEGKDLLDAHTEALLGTPPATRGVRIMVTMPSEAAADYALVRDLLARGIDSARINCAHDGPDAWAGMVAHIRRAEVELGRPCHIVMDLAGPKLRTGPMEPGPQVAVWRPQRDVFGRVTAPAQVWITPEEAPERAPRGAAASLSVPAAWIVGLRVGDVITCADLRGKQRRLQVAAVAGANRWATAAATAYVGPATELTAGKKRKGRAATAPIGALPAKEQAIVLRRGDTLVLTREPTPGVPVVYDSQGELAQPARIPCTLPEVFAHVRVGERVLFDDGKIGGTVTVISDQELHVKVTHAAPNGTKLRADKGINLPDSTLHLPALTPKDRVDLGFVSEYADIVALSFAEDPDGIDELQAALPRGDHRPLGMILKIETRRGFEQLPRLLLAAMRTHPVGVMIARGDLAVECGYERLAEVQEEILWLCEAAHVPVIWATQVLERLAQRGMPSRAEITDAAMGERAECVMLNKGPHVVEAVALLDDILHRMQEHQQKKSAMLRKLQVSTTAPD